MSLALRLRAADLDNDLSARKHSVLATRSLRRPSRPMTATSTAHEAVSPVASSLRRSRLLSLPGPLLPLLALTVLGAVLRLSTLRAQSYWYDEAVTVDLVRRSFRGMVAAIPSSESTPPLYYVLAWGWSRLFGTGEAGLRSLSAVLGTATVPATYAAALGFVSRRSSLFAAALVAVSPFLVWFSQEARAYGLLVFLGTLSLVFFRRACTRGATKPLTLWAITSSLAVTTHYFAIFLVAAEGAWLLRWSRGPAVRRAVGTVGLVIAALVPLAVYQAQHYNHTAWIPSSGSPGGRAAYLLHQLVAGAYPISHVWPIVVAVPIVVLVGLFVWTERWERDGALVALVLGIVAVGAPLGLAFAGDLLLGGRGDYFIYRNLIVATVPLTIAAAAVAGTPRAGRAGTLGVTVACVALVAISIDILRRADLQRPDVRGASAALGSPAGLRAVVVDDRTSLPLKLYRPRLRTIGEGGARVGEIDVIQEEGGPTALPLPAGFHRSETRRVQTFTVVRLQSSRPRLATPADLADELPGRDTAILLESSSGALASGHRTRKP